MTERFSERFEVQAKEQQMVLRRVTMSTGQRAGLGVIGRDALNLRAATRTRCGLTRLSRKVRLEILLHGNRRKPEMSCGFSQELRARDFALSRSEHFEDCLGGAGFVLGRCTNRVGQGGVTGKCHRALRIPPHGLITLETAFKKEEI